MLRARHASDVRTGGAVVDCKARPVARILILFIDTVKGYPRSESNHHTTYCLRAVLLTLSQ